MPRTAESSRPRGPAPRRRRPPTGTVRPHRLAAVGLAAAHLDAHRADPAVPARPGQRARVGAAAGGHRPGRRSPSTTRAPGAGADPDQAVAVQRLRRALVRGHLPAAVPLPGRLRAAAHVPAGRLGPAAAAARAAQPGPAAAGGHGYSHRSAPDEALAAASALLAGKRFRLRTGRRLGLGREGLPARGRQPAVPPRAAGPAGRRSAWAGCSATRPTGCSWSASRFAQHADRARHVPPRPRWSPPSDLQPFSINAATGSARTTSPPGPTRTSRCLQRRPRATQTQPGAPMQRLRPAGESSAGRGRRAGLPDRPRVRAGVQGHRRHGQGASSTARCRSSRSTQTGLTSEGVIKVPGRPPAAAWLRRGVPAHRRRRQRQAGVGLPRAAQPAG